MGLHSILKKLRQREREMRLLMLGLDGAGKTTVLKRVNGESVDEIAPTLGFNIRTIEHRGYKLNVWDVGGQRSIRSYWRNYFEQTDALVWVVDATDTTRLPDCRQELHALLQEEVPSRLCATFDARLTTTQRLAGASLLVLANKQDVPGATSLDVIQRELQLDAIKTHHWTVVACSALTGLNLLAGIDWVVGDVSSRIFLAD